MPWPKQEPRFPPPAQMPSPSNDPKHWPVGQVPPPVHRLAQVPLGRTVCVSSAGHAQVPLWHVAQPMQSALSQQFAPFGWHGAGVVEVEVVLLVVLVVVVRGRRQRFSPASPLHTKLPQQRPLPPPQRSPRSLHSLSSSSSAPAKRAGTTAARALATKSLSALRRLMEPSASPLARSSKERFEVSWLTRCPRSPKGGTRGLAPPSCTTQISMNGYNPWRNFGELGLCVLHRWRYDEPRSCISIRHHNM